MDNSKCVILMPVGSSIETECEASLKVLESRGYKVRRVYGYAAIDQARSQMATDALAAGFEELMWIDSDMGFDPNDVDRLRLHGRPIVSGIYPKKGLSEIASHVAPGTKQIIFGKGGGLIPLLYAATGFLLTHRSVYEDMEKKLGLPICNQKFRRPCVPYFLPLILKVPDGHWYLGEDFAFSERARQAGHDVLADTSIRLWHIGKYRYGWEDAGGGTTRRYETYTFTLT